MSKRKYPPAKTRSAEITMTCAGCRQPIPRNSPYVRDISKTAYHPECRTLNIKPAVGKETRRDGSEPRKACPICDAAAWPTPWHEGCRRWK